MNSPVNAKTFRAERAVLPFLVISLSLAFTVACLFYLVPLIDYAVARTNSGFNGVVIIGALVAFPFWLWLMLSGRHVAGLGLLLVLGNVTGKATELWSITAFHSADGFDQQLSLTTVLLLVSLPLTMLGRQPSTKREKLHAGEWLLLAYAVVVTVSQLLNHDLKSALLLSVGGAWQYVTYYFALKRAVQTENDFLEILKYIVLALVVAILFRFGVRKQGFFPSADEAGDNLYVTSATGFARVASISFGTIYYAGYLAVAFVLNLWLVQQGGQSRWRRALWAVCAVALLLELGSTFTRGAYLALFVLLLLPLWRSQQRFAIRLVLITGAGVAFAYSFVVRILAERALYLDSRLLEIASVSERFFLWRLSVVHFFDHWGFGYGIGRPLMFYVDGAYYPAHSMILETAHMAGGIAALLLGALLVSALYSAWHASIGATTIAKPSIFLFLALLSWIWFANTTALSVLYYVPYESTAIAFALFFLCLRAPHLAVAQAAVVMKRGSLDAKPESGAVGEADDGDEAGAMARRGMSASTGFDGTS